MARLNMLTGFLYSYLTLTNFGKNNLVMFKVYTDVCRGYKLVIHAPWLSTCTGDHPLAKALTVGQTIARAKRILGVHYI